MRILLINVTCRQGSTGKIAYDLYTEYRKLGHYAAVCYGRGALVNEPDMYKFAHNWEVYLHALKTRLTGYVGSGSRLATRRLIRYMEDFRPDVVHLHNIHGYYVDAYALLAYLKKKKIRTVFTMHDEWIFTGKCGHPYNCGRWLENCGNCPQLRGYPKSLIFDRTERELRIKKELFSGFECVLFAPVSAWLMDKAKQSPCLADKRFEVVRNGIDLDIFNPAKTAGLRAKLGLADEKVLLHVTPNFDDPHKGGKYVLELAQRLSGEAVRLIVVGVKRIPPDTPPNVVCISRTENQRELAEYYSLADAFILTGEMESLPTVCLESICCGTPVIGFDSGGARDAAPDGYGLFVEFGDIDALKKAVMKVLSGEIVLCRKEECAEFGRERYGKAGMAKRYLESYKGGAE